MKATANLQSSLLSIRAVVKSFGAAKVLRGVSLEVGSSEFLTILGESGSGKTTLLRLIAGFERPDAGEIWMDGQRLDVLPPYQRRVNTVFQHYALFPHLSVFENVAYGLRVQKTPDAEVKRRVEESLAMVKMGSFAKSAPSKLSGGQQQRVALARALVQRPKLLLLDEPLSALDANLRRQMQGELQSLQREVGIAFVFVTHDQQEAMALSDRIALLRAGELEQVASPQELYSRPATAYTAKFVGQTNLLRCAVRGGIAHAGEISWRTSLSDGEAIFSVRPENIGPADTTKDTFVRFRAHVRNRVFQGPTQILDLECANGLRLTATVPSQHEVAGQSEWGFSAADAIQVRDSEHISEHGGS